MERRGLISVLALISEILCVLVAISSHECEGKPIVLQELQAFGEDEGLPISWGLSDKVSDLDIDYIINKSSAGDASSSFKSKHRARRDVTIVHSTTDSNVFVDSTQNGLTSPDLDSTTADATQTKGFPDNVVTSQTPELQTTSKPTLPTTSTTSTTTTTTTMTTTTTESLLLTTTAAKTETTAQIGVSSTPACPDLDVLLSHFGEYGLIAFIVSLGVVLLLVFILVLVLCVPKCMERKRRSSKLGKTRAENVSDMRSPANLYRPRPSLSKKTPCVPTPLAMLPADDVTSIRSSKKDSRVVMTTDLDATSDPDMDGNGNANIEYSLDRKFPTADRKFSTVSNADHTNVSTFLLRQTSVRQEEERRKQSVTGSTGERREGRMSVTDGSQTGQ